MQNTKQKIEEDVWIPTQCGRCYNWCGILVHRVNGVAVEIQGIPGSTQGAEGGLCPKGLSSLQQLYDPNRLNVPLRRTNPEKGIGVDPKWKEITWEEAFSEIIPRMKKILEDDPSKLSYGANGGPPGAPRGIRGMQGLPVTDQSGAYVGPSGRFVTGAGLHCGNAAHAVGSMIHGSWSIVPDFKYCNYALYFGASKGHGSGHSAMITARMAADARTRGMKLVVFDPMCNFAAGKATEWVPIIPGTDLVVILAMCNVIVNELGIIDESFLKLKTNAPYLVGPDGKYVRENGPARGVKHAVYDRVSGMVGRETTYIGDDETNKPMIWDTREGKVKVYDDPTIQDYALEGEYEYNGIKCKPSFAFIKEHLKQYTPEMASNISTIPSDTIRRIATEFATEARIGSTITIDDHTLPYRPVSAIIFRGGQGHENSYHTCFAVNMLGALVGAIEVPGGTTSWPAVTHGFPGREDVDPGALKWTVFKGLDGFLQNQRFGPSSGANNKNVPYHGDWPVQLPGLRNDPQLFDIQPIGILKCIVGQSDRDEVWKKMGAKFKLDMMVFSGNPVMSVGNWDAIAQALKEIDFIIGFEVFNSETTEGFADIVLPATCTLEEDNWATGLAQNFNHTWGMEDWCYHIAQNVLGYETQRKSAYELGFDILERLGKEWGRDLIPGVVNILNKTLPISEEYQLDPNKRPKMADVGDRVTKSIFGDEYSWEWFKKNGYIRWPKKVEEAYWMWFLDLRIPIYMEHLGHMREEIDKINIETGLGIKAEHYTPLISWFACTNHEVTDPDFNLYCYSYRDVLHSASTTMEQPWLDEASLMNPYTYNITMNMTTGKNMGLKDGDYIEVETYQGRKAKGTVKLLEGHHPQTVGIAATAGHYAKGQPVAFGKGTNFDDLLPTDFSHLDPICGTIETSVRVKINKIK